MITKAEWDAMTPEDQFTFVTVVEDLCDKRLAVIQQIPGCPVHGDTCLPYAELWIRKAKVFVDAYAEKEREPLVIV
jgi:hypothetical protein